MAFIDSGLPSRAYHCISPSVTPVLISSHSGAIYRIYCTSGPFGSGFVKIYDAADIEPETLAKASVLYAGELPTLATEPIEVMKKVKHGIVVMANVKDQLMVTYE